MPEIADDGRPAEIYARRGDRVFFVEAAPGLEFGAVACAT